MNFKRIVSVTLFAFVLAFSAFAQNLPVVPSSTVLQYTSDFTAITYVDANGEIVIVSYLQGQPFSDLVTIRSAQLTAAAENNVAVNTYKTALANLQFNLDVGRSDGTTAPTKPLKKIVSNTGVVTYAPFVPALPDLVVPVTIPSGSIRGVAPTPDPQVQQSAQLTVIMNQLSAIMVALKAKGLM